MGSDAAAELDNLVDEAQNIRSVRRYQIGISCRATVGEVVSEQRRGVELRGEESDPVQPPASRPAGQWRVTERIGGARLGTRDIKSSLRIGISTRNALGCCHTVRGGILAYKVIRYFAASPVLVGAGLAEVVVSTGSGSHPSISSLVSPQSLPRDDVKNYCIPNNNCSGM